MSPEALIEQLLKLIPKEQANQIGRMADSSSLLRNIISLDQTSFRRDSQPGSSDNNSSLSHELSVLDNRRIDEEKPTGSEKILGMVPQEKDNSCTGCFLTMLL